MADDDDDVRDLVVFRLGREGYDVLTAPDGEAALELATERKPDLCLVDVMMPRIDGYELTRRLRATEGLEGVPIILLTASVQDAAVTEGFEAGATDYMRKPFSPRELLARIAAALGQG